MTMKVSLTFPPSKVTFPLMTVLVRKYELEVNILHADVHLNKTGKLIVDLSGEKNKLDEALQFIEQQGINYHVFNGTLTWEEDKCVHCGACTSVCPSGALTISAPEYSLAFDNEKCLVCGLCIKACPVRVLHLDQREIEG
ncbi:MAG: 4Fe-4S binding protein [Clostridiaceae bacterium]|jgi:ferredoxin|nr:4Fe-4S binding protein [Clostridiaceae bacterium]